MLLLDSELPLFALLKLRNQGEERRRKNNNKHTVFSCRRRKNEFGGENQRTPFHNSRSPGELRISKPYFFLALPIACFFMNFRILERLFLLSFSNSELLGFMDFLCWPTRFGLFIWSRILFGKRMTRIVVEHFYQMIFQWVLILNWMIVCFGCVDRITWNQLSDYDCTG